MVSRTSVGWYWTCLRWLAPRCALALTSGLLAAPLSSTTTWASEPPTAQLRLADFASDTGPLDLYVDGARIASALTYKAVHTYVDVPAGHHVVGARRAGAAPTTMFLASTAVELTPRTFSTATVTSKSGQLSMQVFRDGTSAPGSGQAGIRIVQLSPVVPMVDVAIVNGGTMFRDAAYPSATGYATLEPGSHVFQLTETGTQREVLRSPVTVGSGAVESLYVTGGVGVPIELVALPDAVATPASGGVRAGEGGMALPRELAVVVALLVPMLLGLSLLLRRAEDGSAA